MTLTPIDPERVAITEPVDGSEIPVHLMYIETWDGLYAPIGLRLPAADGRFPLVLLASGNGGGGMAWVRDAVRNRGYIMERLLAAGYACAWLRYRTEVELGYHQGGRLVRDRRQGRDLFNRSPLEYEDEIAVIEHLRCHPQIDPDRIGLIGMSHGGEMVLKITSEYHGATVGIAAEPAAHEFLALNPDHTATVNVETSLRNIEEMQMVETEKVRSRIDLDVACERIASIRTPPIGDGAGERPSPGDFPDNLRPVGRGRKAGRMGVLRPSAPWFHLLGARSRRPLPS